MRRQNQQLKSPEMHLWPKELRTLSPRPTSLLSVLLSLFRVLWRCARVNNCSDVELKNQLSLKTDAQAALFVEATHVVGLGRRQRGNKGNWSALFGRSPEELLIMP